MPSNMPDARAVEEALRRTREMQGRSAAQNRQSTPHEPPKEPPEETAEVPISPTAEPPSTQAVLNKPLSPLDTLLKDKERTLLLALLLLLYSEGGSAELLFALFYLLI